MQIPRSGLHGKSVGYANVVTSAIFTTQRVRIARTRRSLDRSKRIDFGSRGLKVRFVKGMAAVRRLRKELQDLMEVVDVEPIGEDITRWQIALNGPDGTPYFGGTFLVRLSFPSTYPVSPPDVTFETKIYHPNIDHTGKVCLSILKSDGWRPTYTASLVVQHLSALLSAPNPNDPLVPRIAAIMAANPEMFERTAHEWTTKYAM